MINIGNLLDVCGIYYTDKQLSKLDKLVNELLKKLRLQQFNSTPDFKDKSRNEDFANKKEQLPFQYCIQEFDLESRSQYENPIKEEILEESAIEIKKEFPNDPFVSFKTKENSEDVSDIVHENYETGEIIEGIYTCVQIKEETVEIEEERQINFHGQEDFKDKNNPLDIFESDLDYIPKKTKSKKSNMKSTKAKKDRLHECSKCEYSSTRISHLKDHITAVHELKKPHKCPSCDVRFSTNYGLKRHIASVHKGKKPFKCDSCDFSSVQKSKLRDHIEFVHEGKRPYQCSICEKSFPKKLTLLNHISSVHERNKPNKCDICDSSFVESRDLKNHIVRFHEGKNPYMCHTCDIGFSRKTSLTRHIGSVHEGKKPYQCNSCEAQFFNMNLLKKHSLSLHEIESHKCEFCNEVFLQKGHRNRHIRNVHESRKLD